jgi:hypothetical protein
LAKGIQERLAFTRPQSLLLEILDHDAGLGRPSPPFRVIMARRAASSLLTG